MSYAAPLREMRYAMDHMAGFRAVAALPGLEEATPDLVEAVVGEARKDRLTRAAAHTSRRG